MENWAWWFAADAGFLAEIGDSIGLNGFYETVDTFEVSRIENLTNGIEVLIREENGRPLWAGNGRGAWKLPKWLILKTDFYTPAIINYKNKLEKNHLFFRNTIFYINQ